MLEFDDCDPYFTAFNSFVMGAKQVASGHYIAGVTTANAWDCAAVKLMIEEAGGQASDLDGNSQRYDRPINGFIGSNGVVHDQLVQAAKVIDRKNCQVNK